VTLYGSHMSALQMYKSLELPEHWQQTPELWKQAHPDWECVLALELVRVDLDAERDDGNKLVFVLSSTLVSLRLANVLCKVHAVDR
jgi:hypothetical protein